MQLVRYEIILKRKIWEIQEKTQEKLSGRTKGKIQKFVVNSKRSKITSQKYNERVFKLVLSDPNWPTAPHVGTISKDSDKTTSAT